MGRPPVLTKEEERTVVQMVLKYADRGIPLTREHVRDAIQMLVHSLPEKRKSMIPFRDGRPGVKYMRLFEKRHIRALKVAVLRYQEAKRHAAVNAETLSSHFSTLQKVIEEYCIDAPRLWNLDETGASPARNAKGNVRQRRFLRRSGTHEMRLPEFVRTSRTTVMPVVSASGESGPPLFVFRGKRLPFREVLHNGKAEIQTYADYLPRGACLAMREEGGGADTRNFYEWAKKYVASVADLTANGRHVLLVFDGYSAHMSLRVLELFSENRVQVYALPAHTSGSTQPLDVVAFSVFKRELNEVISMTLQAGTQHELDMYSFCALMTKAYHKTFTRDIIISSFRRSGLWPLDATRLLNTPRPCDSNALSDVLSPDELMTMLESKRAQVRSEALGANTSLLRTGFVDTTRGAILTSERAIEIARQKALRDEQKRDQERLQQMRRDAVVAERDEQRQKRIKRAREQIAARRAALAGMPLDAYKAKVRSFKERRSIARLSALRKRAKKEMHYAAKLAATRSAAATQQMSPEPVANDPLLWFASTICDS